MTPPPEVELLRELAATQTGTLWLATIDGGPAMGVEVIDLPVAEAAGIDLRVLERVTALHAPGLALPGPLLPTPRGPGLPLSAAIGRPLVLPGHVGDPAALASAGAALATALASLHEAGITHNAINASTLCPGPGGAPQLAITAACALPGTPAADVAALTAALPGLDSQAAEDLRPLLLSIEGSTAAQIAEHLDRYAVRDASDRTLPARPAAPGGAATDADAGLSILSPRPTTPVAPGAPPPPVAPAPGGWTPVPTPAPGAPTTGATAGPTVKTWGPSVTAPALGQTPPTAPAERAKQPKRPRRTGGAAGTGAGAGAAQVIRDHPAFLAVGGLVIVLAIADLTLAGGHHPVSGTPVAPTAATSAAPRQSALPPPVTSPPAASAVAAPPVTAAPAPPTRAAVATPSVSSSASHHPSAHPTRHAATHRPTLAPNPAAAVIVTEAPVRAAPAPAPPSPEPVATGTVPTPGTQTSPGTVATGTVAPPR